MERLTRQQSIHAKCVDCCCGQLYEVRKCTAYKCPLWRYRNSGREETPPTDGENRKNA